MTDERIALVELVENQADGDLVRAMLAFAAEGIMDTEVEAVTGAAKGERSARRGATLRATAISRGPGIPVRGSSR